MATRVRARHDASNSRRGAYRGGCLCGAVGRWDSHPRDAEDHGRQAHCLALANPDPEISYEEAYTARPDAVVATGRSDYPNQLNNALAFPYIFRGALDVRAARINEEMKQAAARSLAALAREEVPGTLCRLYGGDELSFGRDYIIPKVLDPRLLSWVASAVAEAAMASSVARLEVDPVEYRLDLESRFTRKHELHRKFLRRARAKMRTVVFPEGEVTSVVRAALQLQRDGLVKPILLGRPAMVADRLRSWAENRSCK